MRLKQIKLAGFKSFVDATKIPFLNPLTAIIGPNGCGKSNVIDAVRWVLGESSAKHLRGDSMADVIFNGSSARKPVSVAGVELVFDNALGRIGGQYANYGEISVKRQVSRDGEALYFLNGQKCRRKDITDIFMGTGLGPRSYAIIGQGTISRLIECKPQELRVFIEEAAGISRYKERRKDTENRIRHTRENLERLGDIRSELGKQLDKLMIQAQAAKRYREYKQSERRLHAELLVMRFLELNEQAEAQNSEIERLETELAQQQAQKQELELSLTQQKLAQDELSEKEQRQVADFYHNNTEIARIEQQLKYLKERDKQQASELGALQQQIATLNEQLAQAKQQEQTLDDSLQQHLPRQEELEEQQFELSQQYEAALSQSESLAGELQQAATAVRDIKHQQELAATREQHLKQQHAQRTEQLEKLSARLPQPEADNRANPAELQQQVSLCESQLAAAKADVERHGAELTKAQEAWEQARQAEQQLVQRRSGLTGRLELISQWLEGAAQATQATQTALTQLWQDIQVEAGWEQVVEAWLGPLMRAAVYPDSKPFDGQGFAQTRRQSWGPVSAGVNLSPWLARVRWAQSAQQASNLLEQGLAEGELILCRDGNLFAHDVKLTLAEDGQSLVKLTAEQGDIQADLDKLASENRQAQQQTTAAQDRFNELRRAQQLKSEALQQQQLALTRAVMAYEAATEQAAREFKQRQQTEAEIAELKERLEQEQFELETLIESQFAADDTLYERQRQERLLSERHNEANQQKNSLKVSLSELERQLKTLNGTLAEQKTALALAAQRRKQLTEQLQQAEHKRRELLDKPQQDADSAELQPLEQRLEGLLAQQHRMQAELEHTRAKLAERQQQLDSTALKQKQQLGQLEHLTQTISTLKLRREGLKGQADSQLAQLSEQQIKLHEVAANLPDEAKIAPWQDQLESVRRKISRLGAINLAAIEEYEQQKERKAYLDAQDEDLNKALASLEEAIRKIDKETRSRFKSTFEQVNAGLGELFPKVFGGGSAYLALTDDDLLDTGVTIMARPPGKKNSTIHLLSGGEKALTALSLVFAIFRLNPAPFCMLDEVDAPLDDANVDRFCRLLQEMSDSVQFIYISHNKLTMEMADQLIGVTMHEPGVSRIVAVDIEEAVAMADAG
ncbi:chromosome segregation protein SMC [Shewanella chilikensis]|uniref:chromosome segregation protein SMC n=1 Tax=Shewanella chilikensis TaxID=558541 RepID=UPI001CFA656C|nr:chromosome segregation protein SMC [Shewanella chilikensis]